MGQTVKICAIALFIFSTLFFSPALCEVRQNKAELFVVSGTVTAVDWVGGRMVVRTFRAGQADEITFIVPDGAIITKGTAAITFGNINIADKVTVQYHGDLSGLRAVRITVN